MNKRDCINLAKRVERWQQTLAPLGVSHWRIGAVTVTDDVPGQPDSQAAVQPSHDYDSVRFWFLEEFVDSATERELDEAIIHEWMHVAMRDFDAAVLWAEDSLAPAALSAWEDRIHHEREGIIDRLARLIYALHEGT